MDLERGFALPPLVGGSMGGGKLAEFIFIQFQVSSFEYHF